MINKKRAVILIGFWLYFSEQAYADFITTVTVNVSQGTGGLNLYQYTLTNMPASDLNAAEFDLSIASTANLQQIAGPSGWDISYLGGSGISWGSNDSTTDLLPGNSTVFSFLSPLSPGLKGYVATGFDTSGQNYGTNQGQIAAPSTSAVPEPHSFWLLFQAVLLALIGYGWLRARKKRNAAL